MKRFFFVLILAVPAVVAAQGAPPPPPPTGGGAAAPGIVSTSPPGSTWLGGGIELSAIGSASQPNGMGGTTSVDLDSAFAFMANVDYQLNDLISLRAMPRYIVGIKQSGFSGDSASAFDLRVGGTVGRDVAPPIRVYGLAALGYSSVSFPSQAGVNIPNASGPTVTIGGGGLYALNPTTRLYAELAYEWGFESRSLNGISADFHVGWLELGAGVQVAIGH
jgi:hypothetical protein